MPSSSKPAWIFVRLGWRLVVAHMSSSLSYTSFTGRPAFRASSAAWPAMTFGYSSLPPKPPPVTVWTTRTFLGGRASTGPSALWM